MKGKTDFTILGALLWAVALAGLGVLMGVVIPVAAPWAPLWCGLFGILGVMWFLGATDSGTASAAARRFLRWFGLDTAQSLAFGRRPIRPHIRRASEAGPLANRSRRHAAPESPGGGPEGFRP